MSGTENFLARWSRRKREAAQQPEKRESPSDAEIRAAPDTAAAEAAAPEVPLPPIESINAATDVKPFLAPGVAADLARAALRRAWVVDPTIRDFVGLAENAWDFNAPGGVPGFGAVTPEEVRRLLAGLAGESDTAEPALAAPALASEPEPGPVPESMPVASNAASQHEQDQEKPVPSHSSRHHGGALPK